MSTYSRINGVPQKCTFHTFEISCPLLSCALFGSTLKSVEIYMVYACAMGKRPSQICRCFLSLLIFVSNQFDICAHSVSERPPTYGTSGLAMFFFSSSSQAFAGMSSDFTLNGASKICCRIASESFNALWICWLWGQKMDRQGYLQM